MKKEKSFLRILSIIALLMLTLLIAVTSTFSWYPRTSSETDEMHIFRDRRSLTVVGHGKKTITTYVGDNDNGHVTYEDVLDDTNRIIPVNDEKIYYFKTVITETGNGGTAPVALYVDSIKASTATLQIGLTGPEKTYKSYAVTSGYAKDVCIEDNVIVENNGTVEIYWFVKYAGTTELQIGNLYYFYN